MLNPPPWASQSKPGCKCDGDMKGGEDEYARLTHLVIIANTDSHKDGKTRPMTTTGSCRRSNKTDIMYPDLRTLNNKMRRWRRNRTTVCKR